MFTKKASNRDGLESRCIECRAHARRLSTYDLTPTEYLKLGYLQNWECAICRTSQTELERGLVVDHDHTSGDVRALLCTLCNLILGYAKDDVKLLTQAALYVTLHAESDA